MLKGEKTVTMEYFIEKILPFTEWIPYDISKHASESIKDGKDFTCIVRDIRFHIKKEDIEAYFKANGTDDTFDADYETDAFEAVVEGKEPPKRKPGRPRKAKEGDPLPEDFK